MPSRSTSDQEGSSVAVGLRLLSVDHSLAAGSASTAIIFNNRQRIWHNSTTTTCAFLVPLLILRFLYARQGWCPCMRRYSIAIKIRTRGSHTTLAVPLLISEWGTSETLLTVGNARGQGTTI